MNPQDLVIIKNEIKNNISTTINLRNTLTKMMYKKHLQNLVFKSFRIPTLFFLTCKAIMPYYFEVNWRDPLFQLPSDVMISLKSLMYFVVEKRILEKLDLQAKKMKQILKDKGLAFSGNHDDVVERVIFAILDQKITLQEVLQEIS